MKSCVNGIGFGLMPCQMGLSSQGHAHRLRAAKAVASSLEEAIRSYWVIFLKLVAEGGFEPPTFRL